MTKTAGNKEINQRIWMLARLLMIILAAAIIAAPPVPAHAAEGDGHSIAAKDEHDMPAGDGHDTSEADSSAIPAEDGPMRGIWLSFKDYAALGLTIAEDEEAYRANTDRFLAEARKYRINTVFLHVRAFDDAFWRSRTFRASHYIGGDERLTAWEAYKEYDPVGVFLEEAHQYGMEVHAWLNPYRVSNDFYYDPADDGSTQRILTAVKELLAFESGGEKIDGIHFDDYFYNAAQGYYRVGAPDDGYVIVNSYAEQPAGVSCRVVTPVEKRGNVNRMIRLVYRIVAGAGRTFGISPAGNYDNAMNDGADIDTWLSQEGYIDYIIPQIYWTNQWGEAASTTMFSDRLDLFLQKKRNHAKFYVGLALYKTDPSNSAGDPGWTLKNTNLQEQIAELEWKGADGYVYFSAQDLFKNSASEELENIRNFSLQGTN